MKSHRWTVVYNSWNMVYIHVTFAQFMQRWIHETLHIKVYNSLKHYAYLCWKFIKLFYSKYLRLFRISSINLITEYFTLKKERLFFENSGRYWHKNTSWLAILMPTFKTVVSKVFLRLMRMLLLRLEHSTCRRAYAEIVWQFQPQPSIHNLNLMICSVCCSNFISLWHTKSFTQPSSLGMLNFDNLVNFIKTCESSLV